MRGATHACRVLLALVLVSAGCVRQAPTSAPKGPITVGSKDDTEGAVLARIIILMLERDGFTVVDRTRLGVTEEVRSALIAGDIDVYPEYTGTAFTQFFAGERLDETIGLESESLYETVKRLDAANGVAWLARAPADNSWAIAVPRPVAERNRVNNLAERAVYIKEGGEGKLVASAEFVERADGLPAIQARYGFTFTDDQLLVVPGGDTAVTIKRAAEGSEGANAAMAYGTDGNAAAFDMLVLPDPLGSHVLYEPAPTVRRETLERYPEIAAVLDPVFAGLTSEVLRELNGRVTVEGADSDLVAREYLTSLGFIR